MSFLESRHGLRGYQQRKGRKSGGGKPETERLLPLPTIKWDLRVCLPGKAEQGAREDCWSETEKDEHVLSIQVVITATLNMAKYRDPFPLPRA